MVLLTYIMVILDNFAYLFKLLFKVGGPNLVTQHLKQSSMASSSYSGLMILMVPSWLKKVANHQQLCQPLWFYPRRWQGEPFWALSLWKNQDSTQLQRLISSKFQFDNFSIDRSSGTKAPTGTCWWRQGLGFSISGGAKTSWSGVPSYLSHFKCDLKWYEDIIIPPPVKGHITGFKLHSSKLPISQTVQPRPEFKHVKNCQKK